MLHFKLSLQNKDGGDESMTYCQMKISREAILLIAENKGRIPNNFLEALRYIKQRDEAIEDREAIIHENNIKLLELEEIIKQRDELIRLRDEMIRERDLVLAQQPKNCCNSFWSLK